MNNLTQQQMLELACKVYPEKLGWEIAPGLGCPRRVTSRNINDAIMCTEHFNPSLTGGDWQVKQAVDVLTAYAKSCERFSKHERAVANNIMDALTMSNLDSCSLALISGGRS